MIDKASLPTAWEAILYKTLKTQAGMRAGTAGETGAPTTLQYCVPMCCSSSTYIVLCRVLQTEVSVAAAAEEVEGEEARGEECVYL